MRTRKATVSAPPAPTPPDEGYLSLTVAEVLADLASLDSEQLLMVKGLEEAGERRTVILDRIGDLLVVQEAAQHMRTAAQSAPVAPPTAPAPPVAPAPRPAPAPAPAAPAAPAPAAPAAPAPAAPAAPASRAQAPTTPPAPVARPPAPFPQKRVSAELVDQMGDLLAKNAARKSSDFNAAWPLPDAAQTAPVPMGPPMVVPEAPEGKAPRGRRKGAKVKGNLAPATPNGHIVPTDGRRSRSGRAGRRSLKVLAVVVVVALLGAGGTYFWKQTHKPKSTPTVPAAVASRDPLLRLLVTAVPAGYTVQPDSVGDTGPSDLTKAAHDDGAPDAQAILTATGFLHGYQRMWATADQSQKLVVFIYHFRSAAGATSYVQRMVAAAKATKPAPTSFPVPGIPGALGLTGIDGGTHTAAAVFTQGVYAVQVDTGGPAAGPVVQVAQHIASAQFALLPAG